MPRTTNQSRIRAACKMELKDVELLDLHNREFDSMSGLEECINMHTLFLSYNKINQLTSIADCPLWRLDATHNGLTSISEMARFAAFGFLDLSFNNLSIEEIKELREVKIFSLTLRHNPDIDKIPFRRKLLVNLLPKVWILDGVFVTSKEAREAHNFFARSLHRDVSTGTASLDALLKDPSKNLFKSEMWNEDVTTMMTPAIPNKPLRLKAGMHVKARFKKNSNKWFPADIKKRGKKSAHVFFTTLQVLAQVAREDIDVLVAKTQALKLCGNRFNQEFFNEHKQIVVRTKPSKGDKKRRVISGGKKPSLQEHILESDLRLMLQVCAPTVEENKEVPAGRWKPTASLHVLAQHFIRLCQEEPMTPVLRDSYRLKHIAFFVHTQASREVRFFRRLEHASQVERAPNFMPRKILKLHADKLLRHLVARQWLDLGALLIATLEFEIPRLLLQEALTLICLDSLSHQVIKELSQQPSYAITTTLFLVISEALLGVNINAPSSETAGRHNFTLLEMELWKALMDWLGITGPKLWVGIGGDKKKFRKLRARHAALLFNRAPSAPSLLSYSEEDAKTKDAAVSNETSAEAIFARMLVLMRAADMLGDSDLTALADGTGQQQNADQSKDDFAHVDAQWQEYQREQEANLAISAYRDPEESMFREHVPHKGEVVRLGILPPGKRRSLSIHLATIEKVFENGNVGVANFPRSQFIAGPIPDRLSDVTGPLLVLQRDRLFEDPRKHHGSYVWVHHSVSIASNSIASRSVSVKPLHRTNAGYSGSGLQHDVNVPNHDIPVEALNEILRTSGKTYTWDQVQNRNSSSVIPELGEVTSHPGRIPAKMTSLQLFTINQKWDSHFVLAPKQAVDAQNTYAMAARETPIADTWSSVDNGLVVSSLPEAKTSAARLRVTTTAPIWVKDMKRNYRFREKWFSVQDKHHFTIASESYRPTAPVRVMRRQPRSDLTSPVLTKPRERRSTLPKTLNFAPMASGVKMPTRALSIMQRQSKKLRRLGSPMARLPPRARFKDLGVS